MKMKPSDLKSVVQAFIKEQFGGDNVRINTAVPDEKSNTWGVLVSYNVESPQSVTGPLGAIKLDTKYTLSMSCFMLVDDEQKVVKGWAQS